MKTDSNRSNETAAWDMKSWVYVLACILGIYMTIPVARKTQKYIYSTVGPEFFTYFVLVVIFFILITALYLIVFRFRAKKPSQYLYICACASLLVFMTLKLSKYPEEAVHLLEYGLLSLLLFHALSFKIRNWTIYLTAGFSVLLIGTFDEAIQWIMPGRHWGYNDIVINGLAGVFFLFAIAKGFRPGMISTKVNAPSINLLFRVVSVNLIVFTLCLSNTPNSVMRYSSAIPSLSWLQNEEPMTEYGYKYTDPPIGTFYSRFTLEELKIADMERGPVVGPYLLEYHDFNFNTYIKLLKKYNQNTNAFLYEFLVHVLNRNLNLDILNRPGSEEDKIDASHKAFKENKLLEKYFANTLQHSSLSLGKETTENRNKLIYSENKEFISKPGKLIVYFSPKAVIIGSPLLLICLWVLTEHWKKRVIEE